MRINILCVGKIKEKFYRDALDEYIKRLSRYCDIRVCEVSDEKTVEGASQTVIDQIKDAEGERILKKLDDSSYVFTLEIDGKQLSSTELADKISNLGVFGSSNLTFVIGGSLGLADKVVKRADFHLSFSKMTFPHQLMRVILLEQIYRAYRIISNEPYHK